MQKNNNEKGQGEARNSVGARAHPGVVQEHVEGYVFGAHRCFETRRKALHLEEEQSSVVASKTPAPIK
jgi:hypothetical protein